MSIVSQLELLSTHTKQFSYGPFISRQQATQRGLTHYFTGKQCKHGHVSARYAKTGQCVDCLTARSKNPDVVAKAKAYFSTERYKKRARAYANRRYREKNPNRRLFYSTPKQAAVARNLRNRLNNAIKGKNKSASTIELLGCTVPELMKYLESRFSPGMSWENHGIHGWHIDHIKPCASFDLADPEQQRECFHYSNLQPLWAADNLIKGSKAQTRS